MKIDILTLFPKMFKGPFDESIVKRAQEKKLVEIKIHNLRHWAKDKHKTVDDRPFGGGTGMVLMVEPIDHALRDLKYQVSSLPGWQAGIKCQEKTSARVGARRGAPKKTILLTPKGKLLNQQKAQQLSKLDHLILLCGHYEGVDERVKKHLIDEEISIGDYILTGGELPAMVLVDSLVRLIPGVLKKEEAIQKESFSSYQLPATSYQLIEYPHYSRPANYKGWKVPKVLLSGNHKEIEKWRLKKALELTKKRRPDLLKNK